VPCYDPERTVRRAGGTGCTGAPATTVFSMVPSSATVMVTTSPIASGGGNCSPDRPQNSTRQPLPQVPEPSTSPARTSQYVNAERMARLAAIEDLHAEDALEQIVSALADPVLALHTDPDDIWYARLVLREAADPSSQDRPIISSLFDPMARQFIEALRVALPGKPAGFHHWAYLFSVGALTQSSFDARVKNLTDTPDLESKAPLLRSYIIAALRHG
jgi:hypothetical protein